MRIVMMTNSYAPYTGGVEQSIASFTDRFKQQGHEVLIIAPKADKPLDEDSNVFRVSSIKNFNDTNFPVTIPLPGELHECLEDFQPEIVHSHFPFVVGSTAMRTAASYEIPLVFTYHTMYERYIHYINAADSNHVETFVKTLTTGYANLCDLVIAPSEAVEHILKERGVTTATKVIPTGVNVEAFRHGDRQQCRHKFNIPLDSFVIGHVGRLAPEKNLLFLMDSVRKVLKNYSNARFLIVGDGPQREELEEWTHNKNIADQVIFTGILKEQALIDTYHAMDVFAFSSKTETQGMVLAEAMAAGLPVVALKASGVTDILKDKENGYMIDCEDANLFANKITCCLECSPQKWKTMKTAVSQTANSFSIDACANQVLKQYKQLQSDKTPRRDKRDTIWEPAMNLIKAEWDIFCNYMNAAGSMIYSSESDQE